MRNEKSRNKSSYEVNNREIRENFNRLIDVTIEVPVKIHMLTSFIRFYKSKWPLVLHMGICLSSVIWVPLFLAFHALQF